MASVDASALLLAVDRCYEAVLDPSLWPSILDALGEASASTGAVMFLFGGADRASWVGGARCAGLVDAYFASEWSTKNPRLETPPPTVGIQSDADAARDARSAAAHAAFRDDFLRKHDMGWFAGTTLLRNSERQVLISVERRFAGGAFQSEELQRLDAGFEGMRHATAFVPALDARLRTAMLDGFQGRSQAAAIVERGGAVVHLNDAAASLTPSVLRLRHGRLHAADARREAAWSAFLDRLTSALRVSARTCGPVLLTSNEGRQVVARGLPLPRSAHDLFSRSGALIVFDDLAPRAPSVEILCSLFGLTRGEARLASALVARRDLVAAARSVGISHETARTHLKAIFAKTHSANQIECVAKLSMLR